MRKVFAILLFLYAAWQVFNFGSGYNRGQNLAQIMWALLAILGGIYLWRRSKK